MVRNSHVFDDQAFIHERSLRLTLAQHLGQFTGLSLGDHNAQDIALVQFGAIAGNPDLITAANGSDNKVILELFFQVIVVHVFGNANGTGTEDLGGRIVLIVLGGPILLEQECHDQNGHRHTHGIAQRVAHSG